MHPREWHRSLIRALKSSQASTADTEAIHWLIMEAIRRRQRFVLPLLAVAAALAETS